jgi:hypothetical protein
MYQSVYEGDVRFEHCYRVDEERNIAIAEKMQCWRDWTQRFHYGQSRDRISYALARQRTLAQALAAGQPAAPRGAADAQKSALPQPKNLYAPPPPTLAPASLETAPPGDPLRGNREASSPDAGSVDPPRSLAAAHLGTAKTEPPYATLVDAPGASCAGACVKTWSSCKQPCKAGACRAACDDEYRGCMKACF